MPPPPAPEKETEWSENLNTTLVCNDCKEYPPNLVEEFSSGDMVCGSCGLVLSERIVDSRSEWRTFANDDQGNDDPSRVGDGANPLLNGSQLSTGIAFGDGNKAARDLNRIQGKNAGDKTTKNLLAAYKEIGAHCDAVNIPKNVSDTAKHLFKLVDDAKAFKGKSTDAIIAGCIFIACRQCGVPRTFREIYALTKVSKKDIGRTFKALEKFFADDSASKQASAAEGGKLCKNAIHVTFINTHIKEVSKLQPHTRVLCLPVPTNFASVIAVNLVSRVNNLLRSHKVSLIRCPPSVISLVVPLFLSLLPVSTWHPIYSTSRSHQRILRW